MLFFGNYIIGGVIYKVLEDGGEAEEHDGRFEKVLMGNEGSFSLMVVFNANVEITMHSLAMVESSSKLQNFMKSLKIQHIPIGCVTSLKDFKLVPYILPFAWSYTSRSYTIKFLFFHLLIICFF